MAVTFTSRQLGRRLRRLRGTRSLREVAATGILGSTATIQRLEAGMSVSLTFPAIGAAAKYYGAPPGLCAELEEMYKAAQRDKPWGDDFTSSVVNGFPLFIDLEKMASELCHYEPNLVIGLLQTDAYALELHRRHGINEETIQARMEIRRRRLTDFWALKPLPRLKVVMGEWALPLDDPEQMERLKTFPADVRVLPTSGVPYPHFRGPFAIMSFPDDLGEPDCVYTESLDGSRYQEEPDSTATYRRVFHPSFDQARPIKEY